MIPKQFKLNIELVPSTIWYANIYNYYKQSNQMDKWHELKQYLFEHEQWNIGIVNSPINYFLEENNIKTGKMKLSRGF